MTLRWWHIVLIVVYVADLAYLHYLTLSPRPTVASSVINQTVPTPIDQCGPQCQKYIDQKIAQIPTNSPLPTTKIVRNITRHITYLPISVNYSTLGNDWVDIPGADFYFDTADYPGLKEVYFEATLKLFNGNGFAFARLYDSTHRAPLPNSEVKTNQQRDTVIISTPVRFLEGKNLIKVQLKSLTADTAIFTSGRLRIVTEN